MNPTVETRTDRTRGTRAVIPLRLVNGEDGARRMEDLILELPGVLAASVSLPAQRAQIEFDPDQTDLQTIRDELTRMGYATAPPAVQIQGPSCCAPKEPVAPEAGFYARNRELVLSIIAGVLLVTAWVGERWLGLSSIAAIGIYLLSYAFGGIDLLRNLLDSIRRGRFSFDIDLLMLLAAAGAAALGQWAEGAFLLFLFSLAHALEHYALGRARNAIRALSELAPPFAVVLRDGEEVEVPVEDVVPGEIVLVRPAERIPVDGEVRLGTSAVNQAPITGESVPVEKWTGEEVFAGSINGDGALEVVTTRPAGDRTLDRVVKLVEEAQTEKAPTQRFTDRFARIFVPSALVAVALMMTLPPLVGVLDFRESFYRAMALLVAASPCALALGTPSAVLAGIAQAARNGVLIKGGAHLESLGSVRVLAVDKTGTLTLGKPQVTDVVPLDAASPDELLGVAAAVERQSQHPLAQAVANHAIGAGLEIPQSGELQSFTARGVAAEVDGRMVEIGNLRLWEEREIEIPPAVRETLERLETGGRSTMVVKHGERWLGVLGLADRPRPNVPATLDKLRGYGIGPIVMLTGDNASVGQAVGNELGIDEVHAGLLPEEKFTRVRDLENRLGPVMMVGDGINDAPALAQATVGIAMGGAGTAVALETADVALMGDELARLPFAVGLSRHAGSIIRQNVFIALAVIAGLVVATTTGSIGIGPAVVAHEGSTLLVIANALRLLRYKEG